MTSLIRHGCALIVATAFISGCGNPAKFMIQHMDEKPEDERVPEWPRVRALMTRPAPEVGSPAPRFALKTLDEDKTIDLASFHDGQPKVLIFGSYT